MGEDDNDEFSGSDSNPSEDDLPQPILQKVLHGNKRMLQSTVKKEEVKVVKKGFVSSKERVGQAKTLVPNQRESLRQAVQRSRNYLVTNAGNNRQSNNSSKTELAKKMTAKAAANEYSSLSPVIARNTLVKPNKEDFLINL